MLEYNIEVSMEPHPWDNKNEPHFWIILANRGDQSKQTNEGCGWAKTPVLAFEQANEYYNKYITKRKAEEEIALGVHRLAYFEGRADQQREDTGLPSLNNDKPEDILATLRIKPYMTAKDGSGKYHHIVPVAMSGEYDNQPGNLVEVPVDNLNTTRVIVVIEPVTEMPISEQYPERNILSMQEAEALTAVKLQDTKKKN